MVACRHDDDRLRKDHFVVAYVHVHDLIPNNLSVASRSQEDDKLGDIGFEEACIQTDGRHAA